MEQGFSGEQGADMGLGDRVGAGAIDGLGIDLVWVDSMPYIVTEQDRILLDGEEGYRGNGDDQRLTIEILRGIPTISQLEVLVHEMVHFILSHRGIAILDEQDVVALGYGIYEMMLQNPDVLRKVLECGSSFPYQPPLVV